MEDFRRDIGKMSNIVFKYILPVFKIGHLTKTDRWGIIRTSEISFFTGIEAKTTEKHFHFKIALLGFGFSLEARN